MKRIFSNLVIVFTAAIFVIKSSPAQTVIDGHWEGAILISGSELEIKVDFVNGTDSLRATMDIPQQKQKGLKLIHVKYSHPKIYFELPAGPGLATFDGAFVEGADSIAGSFKQAAFTGTFFLKKGEYVKPEVKEEPVPYKQEEVTFTNGSNSFAGTLTIPELPGKHPAVVMITGSGAQNRDEEIIGFKLFRVIADQLTRNGIAVLRYDDRNIGGSTGKTVNESTTDEFAGDVVEAVKYLKTRDDINPQQVGLFGHSEGGIVAPLAGTKYEGIAFMVLMAGTGVKGIDILKEQSKLIMKADHGSDLEVKGYMEMLDEVYKAVTTKKGWGELKKMFKESMEESYNRMSKEEKSTVTSKEAYIEQMTEATMTEFKSPWMQYFLQYDPKPALEKTKCPVLLLFGGKDLQVPVAQNEKPMTDALKKAGNTDYTVRTFANANHLFQSAKTGSPSEYADLPKEFVPGFLDEISNWITARVTVVK